jgi:hypothetical protein
MTFGARPLGIGTVGGSGVFLTQFLSTNSAIGTGGSSTVTITANTNGTLTVVGNGSIIDGSVTPNPGWYSPTTTAIGSSYQIRITPTAGSFTGGTVNTWLTISSARIWTVSTTGLQSVDFTIEIRDTSAGTVLASTTGNSIDCDYINL